MFLVGNTSKRGSNSVVLRYDKSYFSKVISGYYLRSSMFERVLVLVK